MNVVRSCGGGVGSREVLAATMQANCETIDDGGDVVVPAGEEEGEGGGCRITPWRISRPCSLVAC